jgi:hypothetical protein
VLDVLSGVVVFPDNGVGKNFGDFISSTVKNVDANNFRKQYLSY